MSFLPYDIDDCLLFSKEKRSYIYYIHPTRAYGREFTYEDSLFRIVPPNSLIICELKVNRVTEEELQSERSHDCDIVETVTNEPPPFPDEPMVEPTEDQVYHFVEEMPAYPGGPSEMTDDVMKNLVIPEQDADKGITGTFYVSFIVEKDGSLSDATITRGISGASKELERTAMQSIYKLKKFTAGKQNGRVVRVQMTLPVRILLK